jgi:8-oxo-dGTP pyrophosphatase MutT (NUDIX family)
MRRVSQLAAGIVLFREEGGARRYLLVRSALTRRPIWEFPKGGVEAGETDAQAAERELQEEAGVRAEDYRVIDGFEEEERYVFTQGKGEGRTLIVKRVVYYLAEALTSEVRISHEAEDFRWATFEEAQRLLRFPGKRIVLERADQMLARMTESATLTPDIVPAT